ncbi:MAG: ATP synthase F1 subunit delta [Thermodesulfobacteriota bacterium]|nr:ATP synthase F1 subunit delta [Thermodesulfobacteriota bacterium]
MISSSITRRYAEALISIGVEENKSKEFERELQEVNSIINENIELNAVLYSSIYPNESKKLIMKEIFKGLPLSETVDNFLSLLIDKNRISFLPLIIKRYEDILDSIEGRIRADVIFAKKMPDRVIKRLKDAFQKSIGKEIILEIKEDPSIMGGAITKLGNVIYDGSVKTQLKNIKRSIIKGEEG